MSPPAPVVVGPLVECSRSVEVCGLELNADVRIFVDGSPAAHARVVVTSITLVLDLPLTVGRQVTATQAIDGEQSAPSAPAEVRALGELHSPRVLPPVGGGDRAIWVSGVTPGAIVSVHAAGAQIGQALSGGPVMRILVFSVGAPVEVTTRLCGQERTSHAVAPVADPGGPGFFPGTAQFDVDYGTFRVPADGDDGGFDAHLRGRVRLPAIFGIPLPGLRVPLVLVAHGYWVVPEEDVHSLEGYAWLTEHLARWGFATCSISLSDVNRATDPPNQSDQQTARGEVILAMLDRLSRDTRVSGHVDTQRVGLVGHSMGGEGVVVAQDMNWRRSARFGIRGVVSLAPTNYRPDIALVHADYLQLHGSLDYLLGSPQEVTGRDARFSGFRLYDRAWRPRTYAFVEGARHNVWNTIWLNSPSFPGTDDPRALDPGKQQAIGRDLITAFFAATLHDKADYRGYLAGPSRPQSIGATPVIFQHQEPAVEVIEDCGDADPQLGSAAEQPLDKTVNRRGLTVSVTGDGLDRWEEAENFTLPRGGHETRNADIAWSTPEVIYRTALGGLVAGAADVLALRLAQHYEENGEDTPVETWNPIGRDIDLLVELDDGSQRATVRLGAVGEVPYPLPGYAYSVFGTVRIPMDAFTAMNPRFDLGRLQELRLYPAPRPTGRLLLDDVEIESITLLTAPGRLTLLRVHELGTGFGPPDDHIDAEVIVRLDSRPGESFGFRLRTNPELPSATAMLASLRAALVHDLPVRLVYVPDGRTMRQLVGVLPQPA